MGPGPRCGPPMWEEDARSGSCFPHKHLDCILTRRINSWWPHSVSLTLSPARNAFPPAWTVGGEPRDSRFHPWPPEEWLQSLGSSWNSFSTPPQLSCYLSAVHSDYTFLVPWAATALLWANFWKLPERLWLAWQLASLVLSTPCPSAWETERPQTSQCDPAQRHLIPLAGR